MSCGLVPREIAFASHKQIDFNERTRTTHAAHRTQQTTIATTSLIDSALATISQAIVNRLRKKKADVSPAAMVSATLTPSPLLPPLRPNKASYRSFSGYAMRKQNPCTYATGQCIRRWQRWRVCLLMLMLYSLLSRTEQSKGGAVVPGSGCCGSINSIRWGGFCWIIWWVSIAFDCDFCYGSIVNLTFAQKLRQVGFVAAI